MLFLTQQAVAQAMVKAAYQWKGVKAQLLACVASFVYLKQGLQTAVS